MPTPRPHRLRQTAGDYMAIGLAPALIVVLVGSLLYFLSEVLYRGDHGGRLRWTLAWFTIASVLVTRIAIEFGSNRGLIHGCALAGVTLLALVRYVNPPFAGIALVAVAWFCADRLVRDCTLIDDDADATGEGLLDRTGLGDAPEPESSDRIPGRILYMQHAVSGVPPAIGAPVESATAGTGRPPGLWVVGFSLAALPLFGVGQAVIPATDTARREIAFTCLWFYLLSAFGLLLITSFLGLRRYLRQRRVAMPVAIAASWLTRGVLTAAALMLLALLLPRPDATYSLPALAERIGPRPHGTTPTSPPPAAGTSKRSTPGGAPTPDSSHPDTTDRPASGPIPAAHSGKPPAEPGAQGAQPGSGESKVPTAANPPRGLPAASPVGRILRGAVLAAFALAVLVLCIRHGAALGMALREIWNDLWTRRSHRTPRRPSSAASAPGISARPFTAFRDPFRDPGLARMPPAELVAYSFEALQAWASGHGVARQSEETPIEFARRLATTLPDLDGPLQSVVATYCRMAYAGHAPDPDHLPPFRQLWFRMTATPGTSRTTPAPRLS